MRKTFEVNDRVECDGNHDTYSDAIHPTRPFRFRVAAVDDDGNPVDDRGFVHHPDSCEVVGSEWR